MENLYNNNIDKQYTDKLNEFCNHWIYVNP